MVDATGDGEWPVRKLRDAGALRALAHPLRLRLIELLGVHGPATATQLAERVGESPANCSWHLRQLAEHGYIEPAPGGKGRQRYWQFVREGKSYGFSDEDPQVAAASSAMSAAVLEHEISELQTWQTTQRADPAEWQDASFSNTTISWLTAEELEELGEAINKLLLRDIDRNFEPETRPPGARPVRLVAWGVPARSLETDDKAD